MNNVVEMDTPSERLDLGMPVKLQDYIKTLEFFDKTIEDYIYIYDLQGGRVYFTNKICKRFPLPLAEDNSIGFEQWENIVYEKDLKFMRYYRELLLKGEIESFDIAYRILDHAGDKVWVTVKGALHKGKNGESLLVEGRVSETALDRMVDGLTGLCNTEKFMADLKQQVEADDGYLLILGIDNFKNINITQGRTAGDDILKDIAAVLEQHVEYPMSLYRLDGDGFAVILPRKEQEDVTALYKSIKSDVKNTCTVSGGAVAYQSSRTDDSGAVYQYAESALDQAKKKGKNTLVFFSQNTYQRNLEEIELLGEIKAAIKQECKGFYLYYQPQITSKNFEICGVEVLLRYDSPSRGRISPAELIPLLEKSGLICPVGEWVLKTALAQCKAWREKIPNLYVSVNLSYVQLQQEGIADKVLNLLEEAGLPGEALVLEVTESIQLQDYITLNKIFYAWKQYGVRISIDDFGTGYSSLSYLKRIEIDEVKIDRCFVDHVQCNAYNYRLLKNMIELAHSAKIQVCCEGVETLEEFLALQELHTDIYQGFFFAELYTKEKFERTFICSESNAYREQKKREARYRDEVGQANKNLIETVRREEISNIAESMEEVVYVTDVDTYELYYLNAAGRRVTGVYDYKGRKCYQVLQGFDEPCRFCTNERLCENKFHVWERENTYLQRNYILKDKLIRWQGKIVRLEIAIDITEREIVSKAIQKKLNLEDVIVESCKLIASENTLKKASGGIVKRMGEFCQADRVMILKANRKEQWEIVQEWCAEGIKSAREHFPAAWDGGAVESGRERIVAPIVRDNKQIGYIEVDHPRCLEDGYDLVQTMAQLLGYSMIGEEAQKKLNHLLESRYWDIRNHTDLGLWEIRIDPQSGECELYPDKVLCRILGMGENLPPKESYQHWYSRIKDGYYELVNQAVEQMIETGNIVHIEYPWIFPSRGEVMVRCVGIRRENCDGMICLEGYHRIIDKK